MHDQCARSAVDQEVLAAALEASNHRPREHPAEPARHRLAQPAVAHHDGPDALADEQRLQAAARGFDFR